MKLKKVLIVLIALITVLSVSACSSVGFMPESEKNALVEKFGTPQMKLTLEYTIDEQTTTLELTYDLLLSKTPITVINFIKLVSDGYYDAQIEDGTTTSILFDNRISAATNAWIAGRYQISKKDGSTTYKEMPELDYTIKGEFVQNDYVIERDADETDEDIKDNNAKFSLFALAMYHDANGASFDDANGAFFLTSSSTATENYKNYAIFAELKSITVKSANQTVVENSETVPEGVLYDLANILNSTSSKTVVINSETNDTESRTILSNEFRIVKAEMLGNADYSTLPDGYVIK
ncbi:MAG: peptidylprolyl isomerase [Corallococcus sp.]|nr:peptidylprolyl isomerase [Corallococcus sp.]